MLRILQQFLFFTLLPKTKAYAIYISKLKKQESMSNEKIIVLLFRKEITVKTHYMLFFRDDPD